MSYWFFVVAVFSYTIKSDKGNEWLIGSLIEAIVNVSVVFCVLSLLFDLRYLLPL